MLPAIWYSFKERRYALYDCQWRRPPPWGMRGPGLGIDVLGPGFGTDMRGPGAWLGAGWRGVEIHGGGLIVRAGGGIC